jgi:hypothetical protein
VRVGEDLRLDVARTLDEALEVDRIVAERARGSPRVSSNALSSSPAARSTRMPLPPPPAAALSISG